ncbi:MAG: flagellar hook-associated protein 1 [Clostridiales bacterium]|jgi:flagellar hook-associated protein 1 FlgK|nr:flagellar hook-associated protein 1 [Clostridiales bacterium]
MSTFYGLEIARKGMSVSQKAIDVTGHNIANANTTGYTRQRLAISAIEPGAGTYRFGLSAAGNVGAGAKIITVEQVRSGFLDRQFRRENTQLNYWNERADGLAYVESLFDELSETGITAAITDFTDSIQEVSKDPVNKEYRTNMLQNALKMTETFNHYFQQLNSKQSELNVQVEVKTNQINDLAQSIADLNVQIARYELSGQKANDLHDKRNVYLDELSGIVDISYTTNSENQLQISIGGQMLVDHAGVNKLQAVSTPISPLPDPPTGLPTDMFEVQWADGAAAGAPVDIAGGSLKSLLDLRDGNTSDNMGIPWVVDQLNHFARNLASEFNAVHQQGWTMPIGSASETGVSFFDILGGDYDNITAANFAVDNVIKEDVYKIAASGAEIEANMYEQGNNENAKDMIAMFDRNDIGNGIGSFNSFMKSLIGFMAVEISHTNKMQESQEVMQSSVDTQRMSLSGVSLDEEMTNMIKYQHSYSAAARAVTAIDEMLDVLINKTGLVGR